MTYFREDTIAAIATAAEAVSAVGVIRISGPDAWALTAPSLRKTTGASFVETKVQSHRLYRCIVGSAESPIDDGMFTWMKAPRSFTGEDVVELHLHGSPFLLQKVMKELQGRGIREAQPGEFSFRAFRNGKLRLDQAESVADLISSRSEESSRRALDSLLGRGKSELLELKRVIVDRLAEIEVDIDFSDQGLSSMDHEEWARRLREWIKRVDYLRDEFLQSRPLREGIRLALVGAPNSGKSSVFNRLLGEDRSIVTSVAGTTRDVVRESLYLRGVLFRLADTAGIRTTEDVVEAEGIDRSFGEVREANAVLWVFDGEREAGDAQSLALRHAEITSHLVPEAKVVAIWNKSDVQPLPSKAWSDYFQRQGLPTAVISAASNQGLPELVGTVAGLFTSARAESGQFSLNRWRHFEVLGAAKRAVETAVQKVDEGQLYPDLLAADLRVALAKIGEITGEFSSDDLLNHIFSEFCIGK